MICGCLLRGLLGEIFFESVEALEQLGEALEDGHGAQPDAIVEAGRAGDYFTGRNVVRNGGLRCEDYAVADGAMAGDSDLAGENDVVTDDGRAGEAGLRADERVIADARSVADLNEIVHFGAVADFGCADGGAVDGGVGLHVDAVADAHGAGLRDFLPVALGVFGEAEAICADDDAIFERDVVAQNAILADDGVGVREEVTADLNAGIEHDMRQDRGVQADANVRADDRICANVGVLTDDGSGIDDGCGMNSGRVGGRLIEEAERAREGVIGILDAQGCSGDFLKVRLDEDSGGLRRAGERGVFDVGDKGNFGGAGFFNAFDAGDFEIRVAAEFRAKLRCQFAKLH